MRLQAPDDHSAHRGGDRCQVWLYWSNLVFPLGRCSTRG